LEACPAIVVRYVQEEADDIIEEATGGGEVEPLFVPEPRAEPEPEPDPLPRNWGWKEERAPGTGQVCWRNQLNHSVVYERPTGPAGV